MLILCGCLFFPLVAIGFCCYVTFGKRNCFREMVIIVILNLGAVIEPGLNIAAHYMCLKVGYILYYSDEDKKENLIYEGRNDLNNDIARMVFKLPITLYVLSCCFNVMSVLRSLSILKHNIRRTFCNYFKILLILLFSLA